MCERLYAFDEGITKYKRGLLAGIDEAGRGPLAGPVVAASVILNADGKRIKGINDSKLLTARIRRELFFEIKKNAVAVGIGIIDVDTVDCINILNATKLAMITAIRNTNPLPNLLLIDGNKGLDIEIEQYPIVKGDSKSASIAAASIVAKVTRDDIMEELDKLFPYYGFSKHKGYPTSEHKGLIKRYGPCVFHRKTFKGVKEFCCF